MTKKASRATGTAIAPRPTGRPSAYTEALGEQICERMAKGESLRRICSGDGMPDRATVGRWIMSDEAFATKCARARELQADDFFDRMQDVAETEEDVNRARLIVSTLQWRASKLAPKRYGDRIELAGGEDLGLNAMGKVLDPLNAICAAMGDK